MQKVQLTGFDVSCRHWIDKLVDRLNNGDSGYSSQWAVKDLKPTNIFKYSKASLAVTGI